MDGVTVEYVQKNPAAIASDQYYCQTREEKMTADVFSYQIF